MDQKTNYSETTPEAGTARFFLHLFQLIRKHPGTPHLKSVIEKVSLNKQI
jgi:hypothetical protein